MVEVIFWLLVIISSPYLFMVTKGLVRWGLEAVFPTKYVTLTYTDHEGVTYTEKVLLDDSEELKKVLKLALDDANSHRSRGRSVW